MSTSNVRRLNAFHCKCLRQIMKIRYADRITNVELLRRCRSKDLAEIVAERRLRTISRSHLAHVDVSPAKTSHGVDTAERKATQRSPEKHMEKNIFERLEDDEYSQTGMRRSRPRQTAVERVRRPMCSTAREELSLKACLQSCCQQQQQNGGGAWAQNSAEEVVVVGPNEYGCRRMNMAACAPLKMARQSYGIIRDGTPAAAVDT
ncbi:unnamed protein product [Nippostrongylus brasiliensis]|uniref:Uncharacterized protein n=1 Tax=Nippostrongylus brasiliensis TaxID=27835 RepID=A0A0N4Y1F7_NIPBR|nr:unnamed protein product [Nippostrongylus brasiliensis]